MLQLLLERDQSYEDIASLLGGSRDDVRRRARAALEELGGQDPDREVGLTDYILGQADPIGRADAARHLQSDPESLALAEELSTKLRLIAPAGDAPRPAAAQASPGRRRRSGDRRRAGARRRGRGRPGAPLPARGDSRPTSLGSSRQSAPRR